MLSLTIPGNPIAKARPRWAKWGLYSPKKTVNYETQIKERFASEYPGFTPIDGPIRLEIRAHMMIPSSMSQKKRLLMSEGKIRPDKRPDIDNLIKAGMDALQGLAFRDDKQVVELEAAKFYTLHPRLEINIIKINEGDV